MLAFLLCACLGGALIAGVFVVTGGSYLSGLVVFVVSCSLIALCLAAIVAFLKSRRRK